MTEGAEVSADGLGEKAMGREWMTQSLSGCGWKIVEVVQKACDAA